MVTATDRNEFPAGERFFVACPMSSFATEQEYRDFRLRVIDFCDALRTSPTTDSVFFAGAQIGSFSKFEVTSDALKTDADRIWDCSRFILLYPGKILSSALVEIGIALGLSRPVVIVCRERSDLPYVLQSADTSDSVHIQGMRIIHSDFSARQLTEIARSLTHVDSCVAAE